MSRLTNFAENALADNVRGQGLTLPTAWHLALGSAADDASFTELTGTDYARVAITRSLTNFAGTQGAGSVLASSGTSHATSNNVAADWGVAGDPWGTANYVGFFDDPTAGNCWFWVPLPAPLVIDTSDPVSIAAGAIAVVLGLAGGMSDYLANQLIDQIWRGQSYTFPASMWAGYCIAAPSNSSSGTEPNVGSYARVQILGTLTAWSGTDGPGTTDVSTGTAGRISNNAPLTFPTPTAAQGTVGWTILKDVAIAGNLLFHRALVGAKTISAGSAAPVFEADKLGITFQ